MTALHWPRSSRVRAPIPLAINPFTVESRGGFELNLELTVKAFLAGYRIAEVPSTWSDRTSGQSRFRLFKWLPMYLRWYLYAFRPKAVKPAMPEHGTLERQRAGRKNSTSQTGA
jgi:hypothetical protein